MTDHTLHAFSQQLAAWIDPALRQGRFPFRKVELAPALLTSAGEEHPPLLLWINRDSFMAGGLLFLPTVQDDEVLAAASRCAEALGLGHFTLWDSSAISFWVILPSGAQCRRSYPFGRDQGQTAADFQNALALILAEWKQHAVQGNLPPALLSPHYFASLCWTALHDVLPGLTKILQQALATQRSDPSAFVEQPLRKAREKVFLTLLRLIAMDVFALLPPTAPPEGLERAGRFALQTLEPALANVLVPLPDEIPLDPASAVRFHHLLRRFGQLQLGSDRARAARALEILLAASSRWFTEQPLPSLPATLSPRTLLLHAGHPAPPAAELMEVAARPSLAAFNLIRVLQGIGTPALQADTPFAVYGEPPPALIVGSLGHRQPPSRSTLPALTARLRTSWPTRRLHLSPEAPLWGWELLHLLGIAAPAARCWLTLPAGWFDTADAAGFWSLLAREATSIRLAATETDSWQLDLVKGGPNAAPLLVTGRHGLRTLSCSLFHSHPSASLSMALHLPDPLYSCLCDGRLRFAPELAEETPHDVRLFARSSLAGTLWESLGGARSTTLQHQLETGLPIPSADILQALTAIWPQDTPAPLTIDLDQTLAKWLPETARSVSAAPRDRTSTRQQRSPGHVSNAAVRDLADKVFRDGIPQFPEHYLYAHFRPALIDYAFTPPLRLTGQFFDQHTIEDAVGQIIVVAGKAIAEALLLTAAGGHSAVSLPAEQHLALELVQRYRADLRQQYHELRRQAFLIADSAAGAEKLVAVVWKSKNLPPVALFEA